MFSLDCKSRFGKMKNNCYCIEPTAISLDIVYKIFHMQTHSFSSFIVAINFTMDRLQAHKVSFIEMQF